MQNTCLVKLEIRFTPLSLPLIIVLFQSMSKNTSVKRLILTDGTLKLAVPESFEVLKESLLQNKTVQSLSLQHNSPWQSRSFSFHQHLIELVCKSKTL